MLKLGQLTLDSIPKIAVAFTDQISTHDLVQAKEAGLDIVEIRIDQFRSREPDYVMEKLSLFRGFPTIGTIRIKREGGYWQGSESEREHLFEVAIPHVDAVDVELQARQLVPKIENLVHRSKKLLMLSYHDYEATPTSDLLERAVKDAKALGADIVKIATKVRRTEDIQTLASVLVSHSDRNLVVIGMGSLGTITRLSFPALGSLMTFACLANQSTAPGQLPYLQMFDAVRLFYPAFNEKKITALKMLECA